MSNEQLNERLEVARKTALEAGKLALDYFNRRDELVVEEKRNFSDLVSQADRDVETLIRQSLKSQFPDDAILGEEQGMQGGKSGLIWVIDPIDGTSPFLAGLPAWCVSIGLCDQDGPLLGVIFAPQLGELFSSARGMGAELNGQKIQTSDGDLRSGMLAIGLNDRVPMEHVMQLLNDLTDINPSWARYGSGALMLAYVAAGRLVGYAEPSMSAWDCIAGYNLVLEAGGQILPFPMEDDPSAPAPVMAAGSKAYDELSAIFPVSRGGGA